MAAQPAVWGAAWRKLQAAIGIAIAVFALVAALVVLYLDRLDTAQVSAYHSASSCAAPADAMGSQACRYQGQARLVRTWRDTRLYAEVTFDSMPGRTLETNWPTTHEPDPASVEPGATVDAEIYGGKVTQLAGQHTVDNPENVPKDLWVLSVFFGVLGLPALFLGWQTARSAWRPQAMVVPASTPESTPTQLAARTRYAIFAGLFLLVGTPISVYIVINARSGFELAYRAITGVVLFAIGVSLAWRAWHQPK